MDKELITRLNRIEGKVQQKDNLDNFISLEGLCEMLEITKTTYYRKSKDYGFPKYKLAGKLFFDKNEVGRLLREKLMTS